MSDQVRIPAALRGRCEFCGEVINTSTSYTFASGWVKARSGGGTNAVRLIELSARWACRFCIDSLAAGGVIGQKALFDA